MGLANRGRVESFGRKTLQAATVGGGNSGAEYNVQCDGLKWRNVGSTKPSPGEELLVEPLNGGETMLIEALARGYTEFTPEEWEKFGVRESIRLHHFVHAGGSFFVPAAVYKAIPVGGGGPATGLTARTRWRGGDAAASGQPGLPGNMPQTAGLDDSSRANGSTAGGVPWG